MENNQNQSSSSSNMHITQMYVVTGLAPVTAPTTMPVTGYERMSMDTMSETEWSNTFIPSLNEATEEELRPRAAVACGGTSIMTPTGVHIPLMNLNTCKAGMEGLDTETINKIINDASQGSKFYEHKKKQQQKLDAKIKSTKAKVNALTYDEICNAESQVDGWAEQIHADMDFTRFCVHIDMDAFFASVEIRDNPSLKFIPMAVGSESMLSTSNYVARRFGVRAAMPGFIARKLCPQLRIVPCNFKKYTEASKRVGMILQEYDENVAMSMDEADLDITDLVQQALLQHQETCPNTAAIKITSSILERIKTELLLTGSAGIAPTPFLAKICSDVKKPEGLTLISREKEAVKGFLVNLPTRKVCGIGAVTEQILKAIDVHTCGDIWEKRGMLSLIFKRGTFLNLLGYSMGTGNVMLRHLGVGQATSMGRKSISCERTFTGTGDLSFLEEMCKMLSSEVEKDLKSLGLVCKTITLKIKTTEYDVKTRARSIMSYTDTTEKIQDAAWKVFMTYYNEVPDLLIRLMGVRVSNLKKKPGGISQFFSKVLKNNCNATTTSAQASIYETSQGNQVNAARVSCPIPEEDDTSEGNHQEMSVLMRINPERVDEPKPGSSYSFIQSTLPTIVANMEERQNEFLMSREENVNDNVELMEEGEIGDVIATSHTMQYNREDEPIPCCSKKPKVEEVEPLDEEDGQTCKVDCPVCGKTIEAPTFPEAEILMDKHVDDCLSVSTAQQVRNGQLSSMRSLSRRRTSARLSANESKKAKRTTEKPINSFFKKL